MKHNYILLDTVGKTLKANKQLVKIDKAYENSLNKNHLYDFTLLEQFNIETKILDSLKLDSMKYSHKINRFTLIMSTDNYNKSFEHIIGNVWFKAITVYSDTKQKYIYTIMQLVKCELYHKNRESLYDELEIINKYEDQIGYENSIEHEEIA